MKKYILFALAINFAAATISCDSTKKAVSNSNKEQMKTISYKTILESSGSNLFNKNYYRVNSQEALNRIYGSINSTMKPGIPIPTIDFQNNAVFAFEMGKRSSAGYGIEIKDIVNKNGETIIKYKEIVPDGMSATVITTPILVIEVPKKGNIFKLEEVK
ncbi:protease complex subunit PrcB family protein [Aureivirga marina]|uniref:protease complex subunit PrcB family protein n=1 Tax=Aureivirga marina TaxID=1182451 RepID=UPI0018C93CFC|nr:protease complex subunit PrcB family protein [Aureivirga marina]